jgi:hypothetical protein
MKLKENQILLCCGGKACPVISDMKDGMIKIEDDFGGSIKIKKEQALLINDALKKLSTPKSKR